MVGLTVKELITALQKLGEDVENTPVFYNGDDGQVSRVFINYVEEEDGEEYVQWVILE